MRILHVTQGYWPAIGGTELLIQRVSEELGGQFQDEVTVFTTDCYSGEAFFTPAPRLPVGWEERSGVRIRRFHVLSGPSRLARRLHYLPYRLGIPLNGYLRALASGPVVPGLRRAIREAPADVIAASSFPLLHMFAALGGARDSGRPCVLHGGVHPEDAWGFHRGMIYRAIQKAYYIANTSYEAEFVIARGARPERVFVIGVGVDAEQYGRISQDDAKRQLDFDDGPVVGFVGQIGGHKGVDALLGAMRRVWQAEPRAQLLVAGARTTAYSDFEREIEALPPVWRARVRLRPDFAAEDKGMLFAAIDVFAYPSGYESFGIAFLEAWAAGKPVIGCRRGAIPTVIDEWRDGLLVSYQDPPGLALAILFLLKDPALRQAFGAAGREKVLARYTWPEIARRFREVYELAIRGTRQKVSSQRQA
jgi:glycosyltransferase involved in cell wall biosynthesis